MSLQTIFSLEEIKLNNKDTLCKEEKGFKFLSTFLKRNLPDTYNYADYNAIFAFGTNNTTEQQIHYGTCHNSLNNLNSIHNWIANVFTNNKDIEINQPFLEYILSEKESPYQECLAQGVTILRDKKKNNFPQAIIFHNLDKLNIKLATNLLICSRLGQSYGLGQVFNWFTKSGLSKPGALCLLCFFYNKTERHKRELQYKNIFGLTKGYGADQPFYLTESSNTLFPPFIYKGQPHFNTKNYTLKENATPNPCNYIFAGKNSFSIDYKLDSKEYPLPLKDILDFLPHLNNNKLLPKKTIDHIEKTMQSGQLLEI